MPGYPPDPAPALSTPASPDSEPRPQTHEQDLLRALAAGTSGVVGAASVRSVEVVHRYREAVAQVCDVLGEPGWRLIDEEPIVVLFYRCVEGPGGGDRPGASEPDGPPGG